MTLLWRQTPCRWIRPFQPLTPALLIQSQRDTCGTSDGSKVCLLCFGEQPLSSLGRWKRWQIFLRCFASGPGWACSVTLGATGGRRWNRQKHHDTNADQISLLLRARRSRLARQAGERYPDQLHRLASSRCSFPTYSSISCLATEGMLGLLSLVLSKPRSA